MQAMLRLLLVLGGAGGLLARYFSGPDGLRRRTLAKEALAALPGRMARSVEPGSPAGQLLAQVGTAAIVARVARRGGVRGSLMAMLVGRALGTLNLTERRGGVGRRPTT